MRRLLPSFVSAVVLWTASASARPELELTAPPEFIGDGATSVSVVLRVSEGTLASTDVVFVQSAGTLLEARDTGPGEVTVELVAPRVADAVPMWVEARVPRLGMKATALATAKPPIDPVTEASGNGALDLRAPKRVVLTAPSGARVSVADAGKPIRFFASAGTMSEPRREAGRVVADYSPPADRHPRFAVLAAAQADGAIDWLVIELAATPTVTVKSKPNTLVLVRSADQQFGPIRTDGSGRERVRVVAPPGVFRVQAVARDDSGMERVVEIPLDPPASKSVLAICTHQANRVFAIAIDEHGAPDARARLSFTPASGSAAPAEPTSAGVFQSVLELPDSAATAAIEVTAALDGSSAAASTCRLSPLPSSTVAEPVLVWAPRPAPVRDRPAPRARAEHGVASVYAAAGYLTNLGQISAPLVTLAVGARPEAFDRRAFIGLAAGYYADSVSRRDGSEREAVDRSLWAVPVLVRATYDLVQGGIEPYAGVEAGVLVEETRVRAPSTGEHAERRAVPSVGGLAGVQTAFGPGHVFVESKYQYAPLSSDLAQGNLGGLSLVGGYLMELR